MVVVLEPLALLVVWLVAPASADAIMLRRPNGPPGPPGPPCPVVESLDVPELPDELALFEDGGDVIDTLEPSA